jgi:transcriptional antiterminator NusG
MEENNTTLEENKVEESQEDQTAETAVDNSQTPSNENIDQDPVNVEETISETTDARQTAEESDHPSQDNTISESADGSGERDSNDPEPAKEQEQVKDQEVEEEEEEEEENFADLKGDWYVLQVYTGYENRVKVSVEQRIVDLGLQDKVFKVLIPMEDTVEIKNNKRVETRKKMYPGYVFINMILEDDVWYSVRKIPGIARFVGGESRPEPVQEGEMLRVLKQVGAKVKKIEIDFEIGETVRVVAGPFRGYTGVIKEINPDRGKVKVLMSIFGRETPMELEFDQLEKNT